MGPTQVAASLEQIRKRDGRVVPFDRAKIVGALSKAASAVQGTDATLAEELADRAIAEAGMQLEPGSLLTVEGVQDAIERVLIAAGHARTAKAFILYRARRDRIRQGKTELMAALGEILSDQQLDERPAEAAVAANPCTRMYQIGAVASREYHLKRMVPEEVADAHLRGDLYLHDLETYATCPATFVLPLDRLLSEGFAVPPPGYGSVRPARHAASAAALAALVLQSAQLDCSGNLCLARFDQDLGRVLDKHHRAGDQAPKQALEKALAQAMEAFVHQLNAMRGRSGGQIPETTVMVGTDTSETGRAVTRALLEAYRRGLGLGEPAIFPDLVFRVQRGINHPGDPNFDLLQQAVEVAAFAMNPTFSFVDAPVGGHGTVATATLNLPRLALRARRFGQDPFQMLDGQARLAVRSLVHRLSVLSRLRARDLPFLMGQRLYLGAEHLEADEPIGVALRNGALCVGFTGLAEALVVLVGQHHGEGEQARALGLELISHLRETLRSLAADHEVHLTLGASRVQGLSRHFVTLDRAEFGQVLGVTDHEAYTEGHQLPSGFPIDPSRRIAVEAPYHAHCDGSNVLTITLPAAPAPHALFELIEAMAEAGCTHGGVSFPLDHCPNCGRRAAIPEACPCGMPAAAIRRLRRAAGSPGLRACILDESSGGLAVHDRSHV